MVREEVDVMTMGARRPHCQLVVAKLSKLTDDGDAALFEERARLATVHCYGPDAARLTSPPTLQSGRHSPEYGFFNIFIYGHF